jgi:transcriptional regulator with XRE-family HTH domain
MKEEVLFKQRVAFAGFLENMRKDKGISRSKVAQCLGLPEQIIKEWECAKRHIDIAELRAYCQVIDLPLVDCMTFLENVLDKLQDS